MALKTTLLMAQTVDGKVAKASNEFIDWTSKEDKKFFVSETKRAGVMVMGWNTYKTLGKPLPGRTIVVMTEHTQENIETENGRVLFHSGTPKQILDDLAKESFAEVIIAGGPYTNGWFLRENLIDEVKLTVEPVLFGEGLPLLVGVNTNQKMELVSVEKLNENVISLHYKIIK